MDTRPWTKYYPHGAEAKLDYSGQRLTALLDHAIERFPHRTGLTSLDTAWSIERLGTESHDMARMFRDAGVSNGERVAILLPNMPEYVAALFGTWYAGGTVVQVNPAYVAPEIARILEHSTPVVLVTTAEQLAKLDEANISIDAAVCLVGSNSEPEIHRPTPDPGKGLRRHATDQCREIAVLQYTGGTTGLPKAVMLTHENLLCNIEQRLRVTFKAIAVPKEAKVINTLPMCHVYGLTCVTLTSIVTGMNQLIVPRFNARTVLELIRKEEPFAFYGVPTMYAAFLREPDLEQFGLNKVGVFNAAGAPMSPAHLEQFEARTGSIVFSGYGISEASPTTHTYPGYLPRRDGSSGIPVPYTDVRVVQEKNDLLIDVKTGEVGELAIRGPQVMKGYWNEPELTRKTLRAGWLMTGDLVKTDEDGFLYVVGREKDVIVASGYNVYPAEVERVICVLNGIAEVCVIGIQHDYRGETVKAYIVPTPGAALDIDAIIAHCRKELAPFKVPTAVEIVDSLPRTAVGKIDKRALALAHSRSN